MDRNTLINIVVLISVLIVVIIVGAYILNNIPVQLEQTFKNYCSEQNGTIFYPENLDCALGHNYCNVVCTNKISMDEWLQNITWAGRLGGF